MDIKLRRIIYWTGAISFFDREIKIKIVEEVIFYLNKFFFYCTDSVREELRYLKKYLYGEP